jgi:hypothetical protein
MTGIALVVLTCTGILVSVVLFWRWVIKREHRQLLRPTPLPVLEEDRPQGAYRAPGGALPPEERPVFDKIWEADLGIIAQNVKPDPVPPPPARQLE